MQYVRSVSSSVSKTWYSLNPATLSGAIDVIVVEQEDGELACSPFHVRFGKFSLLRPYEKKVEFVVNQVKQDYAMKLGEEGEAFFVFETSDDIPEALQTSPLVSPAIDPNDDPATVTGAPILPEPDFLDLSVDERKLPPASSSRRESRSDVAMLTAERRTHSDLGNMTPLSLSPGNLASLAPAVEDWTPHSLPSASRLDRAASEDAVTLAPRTRANTFSDPQRTTLRPPPPGGSPTPSGGSSATPPYARSRSPPALPTQEAVDRARSLSKKLSSSNIPTHISESGDLMLDMTGYKSSEDEALRAEVIARKILSEELKGNYDIGALIGADERGNLWIYSSEEAKEAAGRRAGLIPGGGVVGDAASDPGYASDGERSTAGPDVGGGHGRRGSDLVAAGLVTPPQTPPEAGDMVDLSADPMRNYAKTLRLTSDQLKALGLRPGANEMSFSVNRATCTANMFYWKFDVPIVISDIDGTITKSDALGHVLNMIGRDWTHLGVAKLYTDIVANGYNIMYLTSRSVGQADTTRTYLSGVVQDGYRLPPGPVLLSPDRTIAALRREIYLRKPEVFKMACLRDILNLFSQRHNPFYAGFGNRLTDALSYRSVNIPSTRIFTINSNAEVSLDLLTLNKYKSSYVTMREIVDHFFPPVGLLVRDGGEDFTDFNFWRDAPLPLDDFSASDSDSEGVEDEEDEDVDDDEGSMRSEDEGSEGLDEDELADELGDSYISRDSLEEGGDQASSMMDESIVDEEHRGRRPGLAKGPEDQTGEVLAVSATPSDDLSAEMVSEPKVLLDDVNTFRDVPADDVEASGAQSSSVDTAIDIGIDAESRSELDNVTVEPKADSGVKGI
ncbi:MAG: Nuclear elongation and deformation protein 1 [Thelocarpon superellum]|nr:MAG: Nuclear elongation and deformation protein 1 [Thelocarpon superellum]